MNEKVKKFTVLEPQEKAVAVAGWLVDKKALDVLALDAKAMSPMAETHVVATARGHRHAQALADEILERLGEARYEYLGMEGFKAGQWILVDCNDVVVHIFQSNNRQYVNLEGLWFGSPVLFRQEAEPAPQGSQDDDDGEMD